MAATFNTTISQKKNTSKHLQSLLQYHRCAWAPKKGNTFNTPPCIAICLRFLSQRTSYSDRNTPPMTTLVVGVIGMQERHALAPQSKDLVETDFSKRLSSCILVVSRSEPSTGKYGMARGGGHGSAVLSGSKLRRVGAQNLVDIALPAEPQGISRWFGAVPHSLENPLTFIRCKKKAREEIQHKEFGAPKTPSLKILYVVWREKRPQHKEFAGSGGLGGCLSAQILYVYALFKILIWQSLPQKFVCEMRSETRKRDVKSIQHFSQHNSLILDM